MPVGLQVFDANSNILIDTNRGYAKNLGSVNTNGVDGSITNEWFSRAKPFATSSPLPFTAPNGTYPAEPQISFSGSTMTWKYNGFGTLTGVTVPRPVLIVYGVY